jgi:hypothetical protein
MSFARRLFAVFVILVSAAFLIAALAGSVGVWVVKGPLIERTTKIGDRVDRALGLAERGLGEADASLQKATESVNAIKGHHAKLGGDKEQNRFLMRLIAMRIDDGLAPQVQDTRQRLLAVTEAAVAINSVLGDLNELPSGSISGPDADRLKQISGLLMQLAASAQELNGMLTNPKPEGVSADAVGSRVVNIDQLLQTIRARVADYLLQVTDFKQQVDTLRSRILRAIDLGTPIASLVFLWIAVSQISLLVHAWSWLKTRHLGAQASGPSA